MLRHTSSSHGLDRTSPFGGLSTRVPLGVPLTPYTRQQRHATSHLLWINTQSRTVSPYPPKSGESNPDKLVADGGCRFSGTNSRPLPRCTRSITFPLWKIGSMPWAILFLPFLPMCACRTTFIQVQCFFFQISKCQSAYSFLFLLSTMLCFRHARLSYFFLFTRVISLVYFSLNRTRSC